MADAGTRYHALDAARGLAILHMIGFHVHRWSAYNSSIQRWPFSIDWWSLFVLSAPPLFFVCFGCLLGMLPWETDWPRLSRRLLSRALELFCWYKLLFVLELLTLNAPSGAYWPALTYARTSGWVEVLDFYCLALLTLPLVIPLYVRLPLPLQWVLLSCCWAAAVEIQKWPVTPQTLVPHAFLVGAAGMRPFPYLFWMPVVLIGVSLGRCWKQRPERFSRLCLGQGLLLVLGVAWWGEGGFDWQDFHLNIVLNGWKHPPHLAYVGLETANALFWLWLCSKLYGLQRLPVEAIGGPRAAVARIGRHPLTLYIGQFLVLFWLNSWLHFHEQVGHQTSLMLASLALLVCFPLTGWLESRRQGFPFRKLGRSLGIVILPLLAWFFWWHLPRTGPLSNAEFSELVGRLSESSSWYGSDNGVSKESAYLHVLDRLRAEVPPGRVYVGVGSEQNFSYIAEVNPCYAFILDFRRSNQLRHLFYKALFEISATPQEWLGNLIGRRLPGSSADKPYPEWIKELEGRPYDEALARQVRQQVARRLPDYGVDLQRGDWAFLQRMQQTFCQQGLGIRSNLKELDPSTVHPSFEQILLATDLHGGYGNFLASPGSYQRIRQMQRENRILPLLGGLGGTQAIAQVAQELRRRNLLLGVFYLSNLEEYLMLRGLPDDPMEQFVVNLEGLPSDERSLLLRTHRSDIVQDPTDLHGQHNLIPRVQFLQRFVWRYQSGQIRTYSECVQADALPLEITSEQGQQVDSQ